MGQQSSTYTLKIDVELSNLQSKLDIAKKTLNAFGQNDTTKQLSSSFDALGEKIKKIAQSNGADLTAAGFEKLLKEVGKVDVGIDGLLTSMKQIKSLSKDDKEGFFPTTVAKNIKEAKTATDAYKESIKKAAEDGKKLANAKKEVDVIDKKIAQNQKEQKTVKSKTTAAQKKIADTQGKKAKISDRKTKTTDPTELAALTKAEKDYQTEIKANQELVKTYQAVLSSLKTEEKKLTTEKKSAIQAYNQLTTEMGGENAQIQQTQNAYTALYQAALRLGISVEDLGKEFSEDNEGKLLNRLKNLKNQGYDQVDRSVDKTVASLRDCSKAQKELTQTTKQQAQAVQQQDATMENVSSLQSRISQYIGMQGIITALSLSLRSAFETVKELDASMTQMAVVTDFEVGDYWKQLPDYTKRASELGLVINDVYQADMLYYQQGLKTNEVIAVSTETMKMAKIAGLETADATDRMTAALRGFNMEINEASAQRISDVYSELAAITASDVDEISTAMTKTASIASSAGMEFETTAAFLSQIIETTREAAETAGTALKTVIARFQELKKDPAEIGEVDGEIVDANKIETALRSVGVALRDSSGQFRELDNVFLELASKWDSLDKNTQRYIATIAAGSRQQSRFIAMMSDYGRTQELVAAANDSAGASNRQFEKTLASLETKLNKLKDAWDTFTMGLLNSDLIKGFVTVLTGLLNAINKIFEILDNTNIPLLGVAGRLGLIVGSLILVDKVLKHFFVSLKNGNSILASASAALRGYARDKDGLRIATIKMSSEEKKYLLTLKEEERARYKELVAQNLSEKMTRKEAAEKAKATLAEEMASKAKEESVVATTEDVAAKTADIAVTKTANVAKSMDAAITSEEAVAKDIDAAATAADTTAKVVDNKVEKASLALKLKSLLITIKEAAATALSTAGKFLKCMALQMAIVFTKKDTAETYKNTLATYGQTMATASLVATILLLVVALGFVVFAILKLCGVFDTAAKRLEKANKELEATEEAVNKVTEEYNNLGTALEELDSKYDTLEDMRRGTEEWNKAVQETNDSVLDLIDTYPELASLVENKGGVLTIDTNSEEVRNIMQEKENQATRAKGALIGAKMNVAQLNAEADYETNLKAIDDFSKRPDEAIGIGAGIAAGGVTGVLAGMIAGAATGAIAGSAIPVVGNIIGLIVGAVAGIGMGIYTGIQAREQNLIKDAVAKENIDTLSKAYAKGDAGTTKSDMVKYIEAQGLAVGSAAEEMADAFFKNKEELLEYGRTLNETEAQQKAYYLSLATNAQQMLDLGKYTEKQIDQMNQIIDEDMTKYYYEAEKKLIDGMSGDELKRARNEFAKSVYGSTARVDGNKILDELGNTLMTFENDEGWATQMAAAKATQKAAEAMQKVPSMIGQVLKTFISNGQRDTNYAAVDKALRGQSLTAAEVDRYTNALGESTYFDAQGKKYTADEAKAKYNSDSQLKQIYGTEQAYLNSLDEDLSGVRAMWNNLSDANKKSMYGGIDEEAYERFENEFLKIREQEEAQWSKTWENAITLGIEKAEVSAKLDSASAQAWTFNLLELAPNEKDMSILNDSLTKLISGLTADQISLVMAEVNAMDMMDKGAWEDLAYTFEKLGVSIPNDRLQDFIKNGIELSGAINKIDFSTLSKDINETYKLLDKIKENERTYSEDDYQKIIQANKKLETSFTKIGDDFVYVGGSIDELESAVRENTAAILEEANQQLANKTAMSEIISKKALTMGDPLSMENRDDLLNYLMTMRSTIMAQGYNLSDFGYEGLSNNTIFSNADDDLLKQWASLIATEGANLALYQKDYLKALKDANVQKYKEDNTSLYNAQQAVNIDSEYSIQHAKALVLQAIESGGVSEAMIGSFTVYSDALQKYLEQVEIVRIREEEYKAAEDRGEETDRMKQELEDSRVI